MAIGINFINFQFMSTSKVPSSKATKISRVYNDEAIEAVKSFAFVAKKAYGSCSLSGKAISKGDKCEMLILEDGTRVTTLLSTTVAKGKKAVKVQSTSKKRSFTEIAKGKKEVKAKPSKPSKKVAKPTAKAVTKEIKTETKSPFSFAKASVNSVAVREALISLALAERCEKQSILEALPLNVALTIIDLTK